MKQTNKLLLFFLILSVSSFLSTLAPTPASAAVSDWQKGASIMPTSQTDFGSDAMKQSLSNLKAAGANSVGLVVPYYQSNTGSTDIGDGWNTPTDDALTSAIDYANSIGLRVTLKVHIEPYTGDWRAYINPGDRATWFKNYGDKLVHLGTLGSAHNVQMIILGTEMVSMTANSINSTNTQNWVDMIGRVRAVFGGKLTYDANNNNNTNDPFENEKKYIGFWSQLDYVSLSTYYSLNSDGSVESVKTAWDYWNKNDIGPFQEQIGKPVIFGEVGYRSVDNARYDPWNSSRGGGYNPTEQQNDYEALMSYWNDYSYMQGVYWWDWSSNPNAGGQGDTGYTPQGKPALQTLANWFGAQSSSTPATVPPPSTTTSSTESTTTPTSTPTTTPNTSTSTPTTTLPIDHSSNVPAGEHKHSKLKHTPSKLKWGMCNK